MTEEQRIHNIAEKRVKEWIEYAKKEYGWENAQYDLFEEPMFELCVQVATLATKELQEELEQLKDKLGNVQMQKAGEKSDLVWKLMNHNEDLKKENAQLKSEKGCETCIKFDEVKLAKAKEIMNIAIEGIKNWGIVSGNERPFEKQAEMLFNLFLDKAEQFIKDSKVEK